MQAARGASLNNSDTGSSRQSEVRRRHLLVFAAVAVVMFVIDQATKQWAVRALADRDIAVLGDWFTLHLVFNPGAAFGTGTGYTWVFSTLALVAIVVVLWFSRRLGSTFWAFGLGMLLAGVSGNFADRLLRDPAPMRGHVVDMFMLPNWPVFNVADICINIAAGVIIVQTLRGISLDGTREGGEAADRETADKEAADREDAAKSAPASDSPVEDEA